jgi:hypothetical protein
MVTNTTTLAHQGRRGSVHPITASVETAGSIEVEEMAVYGASSSLPDAPAKVS